jgi:hypothetical protein
MNAIFIKYQHHFEELYRSGGFQPFPGLNRDMVLPQSGTSCESGGGEITMLAKLCVVFFFVFNKVLVYKIMTKWNNYKN